VRATPYDGRHTYCSLLIHEGRSPLLVAAAMGHSSAELIWRRYSHVFEAARLEPARQMVPAIWAAREELAVAGCTGVALGGSEPPPPLLLDPPEPAHFQGEPETRAAGFEPATSGSGGQRSIR
jgi:hypothetical protein